MENIEIENHPFPPFIPEGAKILIMGTFPPQPKRWNMNFYYPNRTNDFWKIMGLIFLGNKDALLIPGSKDRCVAMECGLIDVEAGGDDAPDDFLAVD